MQQMHFFHKICQMSIIYTSSSYTKNISDQTIDNMQEYICDLYYYLSMFLAIYYVGKTTRALRTRVIEHTSAIRRRDDTSLIYHQFNLAKILWPIWSSWVEIGTRNGCKWRPFGSLTLNLYFLMVWMKNLNFLVFCDLFFKHYFCM